jgi:hypothetical protein
MYNDELKDDEIPFVLECLEAELDDIEEFMNSSFSEISFLGTSPRSLGGELLDSTLCNLRLCLQYFIQKEEYRKAEVLTRLYVELTDAGGHRVEIDHGLLRSISVCEN